MMARQSRVASASEWTFVSSRREYCEQKNSSVSTFGCILNLFREMCLNKHLKCTRFAPC